MPWIGADGDKNRVTLPSQRTQNSSLSSVEVGQVSRPLEVEKASIQLQDPDRVNDKIFHSLRDKRFLLLQPIEPACLLSLTLDHLVSYNDAGCSPPSRGRRRPPRPSVVGQAHPSVPLEHRLIGVVVESGVVRGADGWYPGQAVGPPDVDMMRRGR